MTQQNHSPYKAGNTPLWTIGSAVVLVAVGILGLAFVELDEKTTPVYVSLVAIIGSTVPTLIGAAFSERASRDIRNGVVTNKVKDAMEEVGVIDVVKQAQETTPATLQALTNSTEALTMILARQAAEDNAKLHPKGGNDNVR